MDALIQLRSGNSFRIDDFIEVSYQNFEGSIVTTSNNEFKKLILNNSDYCFQGKNSAVVNGNDIEYVQLF